MLDSIQGSLEGAPRMPNSARLRELGETPCTAATGPLLNRADAAFVTIGITTEELLAACQRLFQIFNVSGREISVGHQTIQLRSRGGCRCVRSIGSRVNQTKNCDSALAGRTGILFDELLLLLFDLGGCPGAERDQKAIDRRSVEQLQSGRDLPLSNSFPGRWIGQRLVLGSVSYL